MGGSSKYVDFARAKRMMVNPPYSAAKLKMDPPQMKGMTLSQAVLEKRARQFAGEVKAREVADSMVADLPASCWRVGEEVR